MVLYDINKIIFGTLGSIPSKDDKKCIYADENGNILNLIPDDIYVDYNCGIKRLSDGKIVNVFVDDVCVVHPVGMDPKPIKYPKLNKVSDFLYNWSVDSLDYNYALNWYKNNYTIAAGGCSSVRCGN